MSDELLHSAWVRDAKAKPRRAYLFLHGILGSGANLRTLAQGLGAADPSNAAVLVDLRLHGRSRAAAPPHDIARCAEDLTRLEASLELPVHGVVGHSFGGKVALAFHALRPALERVVLLDSGPGARPDRVGSEQTLAVLDMLERLPKQYARREQFIEQVHREGHSRGIADWLAMNLERSADGFRLAVDLDAIRALLDSYFSLDLWPVLESSTAQVDVVIGGKSRVWDDADRQRIEAVAAQKAGRLRVHVLPEAGHWVHVEGGQALKHALFPAQTETP